MRSLHIIAMLVAAVGLLATLALAITMTLATRPSPGPGGGQGGSADPRLPDQGLAGMRFPEFSLVDQDARPQTHALLEGHYTIVDFIFTNCPLACPGMTGRMADLQDALAGTGVRFASLSLDPASDTPARLREYATNFGADLSTWAFLTAPDSGPAPQGDAPAAPTTPTDDPRRLATWSIVRDALKFELRDDPSTPITAHTGVPMANIIHPVRFVLVGPDRQVLGLYTFSDPEQMRMLEERARVLSTR